MLIRKATMADMDALASIFEKARAYMRANGNPTQWGSTNPPMTTVAKDIEQGNCYVCEHEGRVVATFAMIFGDDPTYAHIDGAWLDDSPYATVHRMASDGSVRGVSRFVYDWCKKQTSSLRVDTHRNNATMLNCIRKAGFTYCGVIVVEDGSPREAFQWNA